MKFQVERDALADAVSWAARGLPNRPPVPVLAGVLVEADAEGTLTLSAFDYEVSARVSVPADVSESGRVLVSGRLLADIARNLPGKPVDVVDRGHQGQRDLRRDPVHPADHAGRGVPDAADDAGGLRRDQRRRVRARRWPRSPSRPAATTRCRS